MPNVIGTNDFKFHALPSMGQSPRSERTESFLQGLEARIRVYKGLNLSTVCTVRVVYIHMYIDRCHYILQFA